MAKRGKASEERGDERRPATLEDIGALRDAIKQVGAKLVTIDPLMAYLPSTVNSFSDQDMRRVLAPLKELAEETGAAIVVVRHLNKKAGDSAIYRGGGSIGIIGAARVGLLVAKDPQNPDHRVLAVTKNNLSKTQPALAFEMADAAGGVARIAWLGETQYTADDLVAPNDPEGEGTALDDAIIVLTDILKDGTVEAVEVKDHARRAGISERTLLRAKKKIGVRALKQGFAHGARWVWEMPRSELDPNPLLLKAAS